MEWMVWRAMCFCRRATNLCGIVMLAAFLHCPILVQAITLRYSQFDGLGPAGSGIFTDWYPVSSDYCSFLVQINAVTSNKRAMPGEYIIYKQYNHDPSTRVYVYDFQIAENGHILDSGSMNGGDVGLKATKYMGAAWGSIAVYETVVEFIVKGPNKFYAKTSYPLKFVTEGDHNESHTGQWMTSSYHKPVNSTQTWNLFLEDRPQDECGCTSCGMATYSIDQVNAAFTVTDTPISYSPPRGYGVSFDIVYRLCEPNQPSTFNYYNFGPNWTCSWITYISGGVPGNSETAIRYVEHGGREIYMDWDKNTNTFGMEQVSHATLAWKTEPNRYERYLPDGSVEVYGQPDSTTDPNCRYFISSKTDAHGNTLTYQYDYEPNTGGLRLLRVVDALGKYTQLSYELAADPLKVTKVTDPYGRSAILGYDSQNRLTSSTDPVGIVSQFKYAKANAGGYLNRLITPYGLTSFNYTESASTRILLVTDPQGGQQRVQYFAQTDLIPAQEPASAVPDVVAAHNVDLNLNNVFYWDKKAMSEAKKSGDATNTRVFFDKATVRHFLMAPEGLSRFVASEKKPLENRVWYTYQNQPVPNYFGYTTILLPAVTARRLDDGADQVYTTTYSATGRVLESVDPMGRATVYQYDTNGVDLLNVSYRNGTNLEITETYTGYINHQPWGTTDASGLSSSSTYNAYGQIETATQPNGDTVTYAYFPSGHTLSGHLHTVTRNINGATTTYAYDDKGRTVTVTDAEGYSTTNEYDDLNRVTKVTYPDGSYTQTYYWALDAEWQRDRMGRWTHSYYNALRQIIGVEDPAYRYTAFAYCTCGSLEKIVDPKGNATKWLYDVQGRKTAKIYPDNKVISYEYENTTSRLKSVTDAMEQRTEYTYNLDDTTRGVHYANALHSTPDVNYTYDPVYGRPVTMTDGTGTTTYSYNAYGIGAGSGQLHSITGPAGSSTYSISYTYDELGRRTASTLDGVTSSVTFDTYERLATETNALGTFTYSYASSQSGRVAGVAYPNNQTVAYTYDEAVHDFRLKQIKNLAPDASVLSQFDYGYNVVGNITQWKQTLGSSPTVNWNLGYDAVDQLLTADIVNATTKTSVSRYDYQYDLLGNRTGEQVGQGTVMNPTKATYNNLNQIQTLQSGRGPLRIEGAVNKASTVKVNGQSVTVDASNRFGATINATTGTNSFTVSATDASSQTTTRNYSVYVPAGSDRSYTYDFNGNLLSDGLRTYEWDALNRLIAINYNTAVNGIKRSEFAYDGNSRRTRITEKSESDTTLSDKVFVWIGNSIAEEREATGASIVKRFYGQGQRNVASSTSSFYTRDHLGSVRELSDSSGAIQAQYSYDPYGRLTKVAETAEADFLYTGHHWHAPSGLFLTLYRAYESNSARWLSRDSLKDAENSQGPNLYAYVSNNAINNGDPYGLYKKSGGWFGRPVTFTVESREIFIFYGHYNIGSLPVQIRTPEVCSAAGVATCYPDLIVPGITHPLPDLPTHHMKVWFGPKGDMIQRTIDENARYGIQLDGDAELRRMRVEAKRRKRQLEAIYGGNVKITEYRNGGETFPEPFEPLPSER